MKTGEIKKAFDRLSYVFDSKNTNWAKRLFEECRQEEKSHRGFAMDFDKYHPHAASIADMARLFAVKRVAEYLLTGKYPVSQDYLHTQTSCFIAAGIADEFGKEVREAWKDFDLKAISELNYTNYVKVEAA